MAKRANTTVTTTEPATNGTGKQRPVHEVRLGRICGAVWQQTGSEGKPWFSVTFSRIYRTEDGNWARSDSFSRHDLPLVQKVADQIHTWLYQHGQDENS
jgi:hypothetical protein